MVSLHAALAPEEEKKKTTTTTTTTSLDLENFLSKKRKCRDGEESRQLFARQREPKLVKAMDDVELNLDFPLPSDWQRCLDIESGQIYFYNTTQGRTLVKPRLSLDPLPTPHVSLDLELNLTCAREREDKREEEVCAEFCNSNKDTSGGVMVAAVCRRCHLLVVMSKATLLCPNCKFVQPPP